MPSLHITTLGTLAIMLDETLLTRFDSDKARALLIYLAIETAHPHRRESLLTLFWPELNDQQARKNLSQTLYRLRYTLKEGTDAPSFFHADRQTLQLNPTSDCWIDVVAFRETLHQAAQIEEPVQHLALLRQAAELYQGDFLAGVSLVNSEEFEMWALALRDDLHACALTLFEQLVTRCSDESQEQAAQSYAQRLVALDPLREASHRLLMHTLAATGNRIAALQQYETCCALLQQELRLLPEPATTELYEQLRHGSRSQTTQHITAKLPRRTVAQHAPPCPYPGLLPFATADAPRFFGRTAEIATLLERLHEAPLQAVIGPSGSGKSSLVFAGLIPTLQRQATETGRTWEICTMRPGVAPLQTLAVTLADTPASALLNPGQHPPTIALTGHDLLLVVDQFEEIFTVGSSEALPFQHMLLRLVDLAACSIILTIRADFYPDLMVSPLWAIIREQRTEIAPLDAIGLRQAILRPAQAVGVEIETALVERLIADAANAPGVLPLVQETLTLLWEDLEGYTTTDEQYVLVLPLVAYERLGEDGYTGVQVALARRASAVLAALSPAEQAIVRRVLLRLIQFGEGQIDTRRQQRVADLRAASDCNDQFDSTLNYLAQHRLITVGGANDSDARLVDLAHEALITGWPTLQSWLSRQRSVEQFRRQLAARTQEWVQRGRGRGGLLDEVELLEAERWLQSSAAHDLGYDDDLTALVAASRDETQARDREKERVARQLRQRAFWLSGALAVALIAATLAGLFALTTERAIAEVQGLALLSAAQLAQERGDPDTARALAVAAMHTARSSRQAETVLTQIGYRPGTRTRIAGLFRGVEGVALSPRDDTLVAGGEGGTLLHVDLASGQVLQRFEGHNDNVESVVISPDGQTVLSGSWDGTARLWDMSSGKERYRYVTDEGEVNSVALTPDGETALVGMQSGHIVLLHADSGRAFMTLDGHSGSVKGLVISPDGQRFLSGSWDGTVRLWDLASGKPMRQFTRHSAEVNGVAFSPDGMLAASGSHDMSVRLWDTASGEEIWQLTGHTAPVWTVAFSPDGRTLYSGSWDNTIRVWDVASGRSLETLYGNIDVVRQIAITPDGRRMVSSNWSGALRLWDLYPVPLVQTFDHQGTGVQDVAFSPDGGWVVSGATDGRLRLWTANRGATPRTLRGHSGAVWSVAFSPDGQQVVSGGADGTVRLWAVEDSATAHTLRGHNGTVWSVAFSPDGQQVVSGGADGTVRLWAADSGTIERTLYGHSGDVRAVAFSPDGQRVVSGSYDSTVRIWDRTTGSELRRFVGHSEEVIAVAFRQDGNVVASGSWDNTVQLWDVETGQVLHRLAHPDGVQDVAFSPDGQIIVSAGEDATLHFWEVATGQSVRRWPGHRSPITGLAFDATGETIASSSDDMTVRLWQIDTQDELIERVLTNRYVPALNCEQRELYQIEPRCS